MRREGVECEGWWAYVEDAMRLTCGGGCASTRMSSSSCYIRFVGLAFAGTYLESLVAVHYMP